MALPVNIDKLLHGKVVEWERLDFKRGWNPDDVMHTACAFANDIHNWGGGYIIIGVEESNGTPVLPPCGVLLESIDAIQKELVEICNIIQPVCNIISEPVEVDGQMVLVVYVPGGDARPYKAPTSLGKDTRKLGKRYYVRQGSVTRIANEREEQQLMRLCNKIPFDDRVCHQASLNDLSPLLIKDYLRCIGSRLTITDAEAMPFEQLCWNMQIVGGTQEYVKPKNVGLLFFSDNAEKYIPCAHIEIVRFGHDVSTVFEEKILSGPIHQQLRQALDYLKSQVIIEKVIKVEGQAEAVRAFNYPYGAVEEIVANAVYHKSWDERTPIEINIYPDKIQVYNIEGPMPPITNDDLKRERVITREYRNRRVGDFLKELDLTEGRNTGFPKIYNSLRHNGSPAPEFETDATNRYFMATIHVHPAFLKTDPDAVQTDPDMIQSVLEKELRADLEFLLAEQDTVNKLQAIITDNPVISRSKLAQELSISERKTRKIIDALRRTGRLERQGGDNNGKWVII